MGIRIIKPGLQTTIQDYGRFGYQKEGMIVSGAMDKVALRIANILIGNNEKEACIEITQPGPAILFEESCIISLTGADLSPTINAQPVPLWRPVYVCQGSLLEFGKSLNGYWTYIAFAGGLAIPEVLGSYSTYSRAQIGGWHGRALRTDDRIAFRTSGKDIATAKSNQRKYSFAPARWTLSPELLPVYKLASVIRVIKGPEYDLFTEKSKHNLWQSPFRISHQSDRMGYRLQGSLLSCRSVTEMLSSAVTSGTIQVPANGNPIVLMADHQTTGGYPRIGQVATVDIPLLAQAPPGHRISFGEVSLADAQHLYMLQEKKIQLLIRAVKLKAMSNLLL